MKDWLPRSILGSEGLHLEINSRGCSGRGHGWTRGAPAGDGICNRIGRCAAGGTVLRHRRRVPDLRPGRIDHNKSAAPRGFCRRGLRHRREVWFRRTVHVYAHGRSVSWSVLGATGLGTAVKFIPRPVVVGVHELASPSSSPAHKSRIFSASKVDKVPGEFLARIDILARSFRSLSPRKPASASSRL